MKLLIPVLLLTLVAVGSSIVKVSERGARTAHAAASDPEETAKRDVASDAAATTSSGARRSIEESATGPATDEGRFVRSDDGIRATVESNASAGPLVTLAVEVKHLDAATFPETLKEFFKRRSPTWFVGSRADAKGRLNMAVSQSAYDQVRDMLNLADQLKGDEAAQTDLDALRTSTDLLKAGKPRHYALKRVNAGEVAGALRDVLSPDGKPRLALHADPHHRQLYLSGSESLLDAISKFVAEVESPIAEGSRPGEVRTIEIQAPRIERDKLAEIVRKLFAASDFNEKLRIRMEPDRPTVSLTAPQPTCVRVGNVVDALNAAVEVAYAEPQLPPAAAPPVATAERPSLPVHSIALKHTDPANVAKALYDLYPDLNDRGVMISADGENRTLWIRAGERLAVELAEAVGRMEKNAKSQKSEPAVATAKTMFIKLEKTRASTMKELLQTLYPDVVVHIAADDRSNTVLIRAEDTQLREFEAIIMRLDASPSQAAVSSVISTATPADAASSAPADPPADRQQLAQTFRELDQKAAALADEIRQWHAVDSDTEAPQIAPLTGQLLSTVAQAFEARQRWQIAELAVLRARLERLDQEIQSREQAKMQIIERRTRELIEGKAMEGDAPAAGEHDRASSTRATSGTDGDATPNSESTRAALEGRIAEAQRALVRDNLEIQKRREELDQGQLDPKAVDAALQRLFAEDEPLRQYGALLEERKKKVYELKAGSPERTELEQDIIRIETSVASRQSGLRPAAEEIVLREGREWVRKAQAAVKQKQRLINRWKHQLREIPLRDAASDAAPLPSGRGIASADPRQTVDDSVRTALLTKLAEAETELELERIRVQTQREKFERFAQKQTFSVDALREVLSADPRYVECVQNIERIRGAMASAGPKARAEYEKRYSEDVTRLEALKAKIQDEYKQNVIARERAKVEREEESVKSNERYVELLKQKLRERKESSPTTAASPSTSAAPPSSGTGPVAGDSVRTFLLDEIAKAEIKRVRAKIEAQEAHDVQDGKAPEQYETELGYRFTADPEVRRLRKSIGQLKDEFNASKPGTPAADDLKKRMIVLESELESRIAELRPTAEQSLRSYHTGLVNARDREVRLKERAVELLKQQLQERDAGAPSKNLPFSNLNEHDDATPHRDAVNRDRYRRAAGVWMTDVEAAAARAQELKRPLLIYTDPQMQTLDLESEKEWMALPEVLDLLEKSFVAVRFRDEHNLTPDQAQLFPIVEIADFLPTKAGVQGKRRVALAKFHYDQRFLDLLQKIAAEYEGVSVAEGPKRTAPDAADEFARDLDQETEGSAASLRDRLIAALAEVETATASVNKARAALAISVAAYNTSEALKPGDEVVEARKAAASAAEREAARAVAVLQTKKKRAGWLGDELRGRVRLLELDLSDSEARLQKAKADVDRTKQLVERGIVTRTALEDEQLKSKQAESDVERTKVQLDLYRRAIVPISTDEPKSDEAAKPGEPPAQPDAEPFKPGAAVPRGPIEDRGAIVDDGDEILQRSNRKRPNPYRYDAKDYAWLRGTVSRYTKEWGWQLRYVEEGAFPDRHGGVVLLAGPERTKDLVEGDVVYVRGKIDPSLHDGNGHPVYRVENLDILKPKSK